jgi:hypothetical protein
MFIYTLLIDLSRKIGSGSKNCRIGTLATLPKLTRTSNCTPRARVQLEVRVNLRDFFIKIIPVVLPLPVDTHDSQCDHFRHVFHFPPRPGDL